MKRLFAIFTCAVFLTACNDETTTTDSTTDTTTMNNEEIIELLTQIKGVGKWTVEMLLMFTLGREDVFAIDDYGIQSAIKKLYKFDDSNKKEFREKMLKLAAKWSPYRTYACMHLWQWKDEKPQGAT